MEKDAFIQTRDWKTQGGTRLVSYYCSNNYAEENLISGPYKKQNAVGERMISGARAGRGNTGNIMTGMFPYI